MIIIQHEFNHWYDEMNYSSFDDDYHINSQLKKKEKFTNEILTQSNVTEWIINLNEDETKDTITLQRRDGIN